METVSVGFVPNFAPPTCDKEDKKEEEKETIATA